MKLKISIREMFASFSATRKKKSDTMAASVCRELIAQFSGKRRFRIFPFLLRVRKWSKSSPFPSITE